MEYFHHLEKQLLKKNGNIGILATKSVIESKALDNYIKKNVQFKIHVTKINATLLVDLVESGKFLSHKQISKNVIKNIIGSKLEKIDVVTLSSTHLPFLMPILKELFPNIMFLNPADSVAINISQILKNKRSEKNKLRIFTSGNVITFQKQLSKIGIENKVNPL